MKESKKVQFEKFAALLALEAQGGQIDTKSELESRADLLSPPLTGRHFHFSNIDEEVEALISTKTNGRGKTFKITPKGKSEIYDGLNSQILVKLLGRAMRSVGNQFSSYGQISEELKVRNTSKDVSLEEFAESLNKAISKTSRMSGWAKLEEIQKFVCARLGIQRTKFLELCRKVASKEEYDLAPGRKGEKITVNGKAYGLIRRKRGE